MKPLTIVLFCLVTFGCVDSLAAVSAPPVDPNSGAPLQVQVTFPQRGGQNEDPQLIGGVVARIQDVFRGLGYVGSIVEVTGREQPTEGATLLHLMISEVKTKEAVMHASFTATLRTETEKMELGRFDGLQFRRSETEGNAADVKKQKPDSLSNRALEELYRARARTALVPGLNDG